MRFAFWRRKSIAEHMAPLTRIIDGLRDHAEHHEDKAAEHAALADTHKAEAATAEQERARALAQMVTIQGIIG